jgi:hypothetical protein
VATERQIAANRANAKRSTGPKTRGGKRRASQNAYVHGLAGQRPIEPDVIATLEQAAREIVQSTNGRINLFQARSIAQAQQDLLRARSISAAVVAKTLPSPLDGGAVSLSPGRSPQAADGAGAIERAVALLRVLDRYEHRALARRDRAIRLCWDQ